MPIWIKFVPEVGNWEASVNSIPVVAEDEIPLTKVVTASPATVPLHWPSPHPSPGNCSAGPTG